ncbi:hypothetical protein BSA16_33955 [Micromonospora sp. Rc5]|nr:hypothetical protein BSA16_33955 [Micromonospora sp. Rc5]
MMYDRLFRERPSPDAAMRSFAYRIFPWESNRWHVGVLLAESGNELTVVGVGLVHRGRQAATYERNVDVEDVTATSAQIHVTRIKDRLGGFADAVSQDGPITEARGRRLLDALVAESPDLKPVIARLVRRISDSVTAGTAGELQGLQKDGTGVLLMARGMDRSELRQYVPQPAGTPFIAGVSGASMIEPGPDQVVLPSIETLRYQKLRTDPEPELNPEDPREESLQLGKITEDQLINHDADRVPFQDWFRLHDQRVGWRTFTDGFKRMEIFNANRSDAEHEMGIDLIYHNVAHDSFVMIQYKRMRPEADLVYRPDHNLSSELERMAQVDEECRKHDIDPSDDVRLLSTPCMVKLCAPQTVVQDSIELITGMYLSREHFETLLSSPLCQGPRGGVCMTFGNVPRYLNNTTFAELLGAGWIGSRGRGSDYVGQQIAASLEAGRSVVAGIDRTPRIARNRRSRSRKQ